MKRKLLLLFALMAIGLSHAWAYDFSAVAPTGQTLYYNIVSSENRTCEVTYQYEANPRYANLNGVLEIPSTVTPNGTTYSVISIGYCAFRACNNLASVTIPSSVTSIGEAAFERCTNLTSVTIPNSVITIGDYAFDVCTRLTSVTIPNSVSAIGYRTFGECSGLTNVTIPNPVVTIGDQAFYGCSGIVNMTIPNSVVSIGSSAFQNCTSLMSVTIPNSVVSIGSSAFQNCTSLTSVTIPNSVTRVGANTFWNCTGLINVTIPSSVVSIGSSAFRDCSGLTSVTIPNLVTSIEARAFGNCTSLTSITIETETAPTITNTSFSGVPTNIPVYVPCGKVSDYQAANCWNQFTNIQEDPSCSSHYDLYYTFEGSSATVYGSAGFNNDRVAIANNGTFEELEIPSSVTYNGNTYSVTHIGNAAFYNCNGLTSVTIPNSVTTIGASAFYRCTGFTDVTIPNSVTAIGDYAFESCTGLTSVTIPESVTTIGDYAFYYCRNLTSFVLNATNCVSMGSASGPIFHLCNLSNVIIGEGVTRIPNFAFYDCIGLTSVTIPSSVTTIGDYAFYGCSYLTSMTIPNSVTTIGDYAFQSCDNLTSITIPESVTTIGKSAFNGCIGLTSVTIPNSVTSIGDYTFSDCHRLTSMIIPNSVTSIGNNAFSSCSGLTSVTIPNSVTSIGNYAFSGCSGLTSVTIPNSVTSIGNGTFYHCSGLTSVTIPNSVTSIGNDAFSSCSGLTSVTIPNSVTSIGNLAFYLCSGLTSVTIGKSVTNIGNSAFYQCNKLKTVYNHLSNSLSSSLRTTSYGLCAKRIVYCTSTGSGLNTLYKIPEGIGFTVADQDESSCSNNQIPKADVPDNFIYKYGNSTTWVAKNIVLTDCQDEFYSPVEFTAANATYTRTFTDGNRSTLCLPFTTEIPNDFEVYEFTGFNGSTISFTKKGSGNIEAYVPYLVGKDITPAAKANTSFTFSKQNAVFPATNTTPVSHDNMSFQGVMARTEMTNTNSYGYKDGYFVRSGGSAHVNPFRCYFTLSGSQSAPATLSVDTDGDYLGIEDVDDDMEQSSIRYSNDVYDMMGRLVRKDADNLRGLPRGIYIWRGKKQIAY